jgi:hypothetical protein
MASSSPEEEYEFGDDIGERLEAAKRKAEAKRGSVGSDSESEEEIDLLNPKVTTKKTTTKTTTTPNYRREYCSQPIWSQLRFEQMMRKQRPEWFKDVAPSEWFRTPTPAVQTPTVVVTNFSNTNTTTTTTTTNDNGTSKATTTESSSSSPQESSQSQHTPSPLSFVPRLGDNEYNLRMYQEHQRAKLQIANGIDVTKVVEDAEVAAGLRPKPSANKRKVSSKEEAKKKACADKKLKKQEEKKAKEAEAARLASVRLEIDSLVDRFQPEYYASLEVQEEKKPGDKEDMDYSVVKWFVVKKGKPGEKRYDINDFTHQHLRKLASKCNVKGAGTLSIWNCRTKIAAFVTAGTIYQENRIANPFTDKQSRRLNTYMRLINVFFLSNMVQRFIDLNDRKKREDYEAAHGGDPVKAFFVEASNICNDASMSQTLSKVCGSNEGENEHLFAWQEAGDFNLNDFDPQTYATCLSKAYDLLKAREIALGNMRKSGTHDSDFWNFFCTNPRVLKWRLNGQELPAKAVYYVDVMCKQFPSIDGKFADKLHDCMKSDSNVAMTGDAGYMGKDKKLSKGEKEMMKRMDEITEQQRHSAERVFKQREAFIEQQKNKMNDDTKRATAAEVREGWKEYIALGKEFKEMVRECDDDNNTLLRNLAKRLQSLEDTLNIDRKDSIVAAFMQDDD